MKKSFFLFQLAVLCGTLSGIAQEQPLVTIHKLSGSDLQVAISSLGKLTFTNDTVCLISTSGEELACEPQSNVKSISFVAEAPSMGLSNVQERGQITIFPNPTADLLHIQGVETPTTVRIFDLQGKVCKAFPINELENTCNIADMPQGTYYLQINTHIVKLIKQ